MGLSATVPHLKLGELRVKGEKESLQNAAAIRQCYWNLEILFSTDSHFCVFMTLPLSSICQDGLAVNGGTFLVSHTPRGSRLLCRERKSLLCCLQLWERKQSWMAIVAVATNVCGLISGSIPTLNVAENVLLNFLSSYIYCNVQRTSKAASRSAVSRDHVHSNPWLLKMIAFLTNYDSIDWLLGWTRTHYCTENRKSYIWV